MALTPQQEAFVAHDPSRSGRVLAGPGTGKSFTSVQFLERLAKDRPDVRVRMLTFTRAATAEFASKIGDAELTGLGIAPPATVHSFALSLLMRLRNVALPMPLRIPDTWEMKNLVRPHLATRLKMQGYQATPTIVESLERELAAGWESLDPERELYSEKDPSLGHAYAGLWQEHRWKFGYVMLAELPFQAGNTMSDHGTDAVDLDLLLVDEYQDLNEADIRMVRVIAEGGVPVLAIGDDDQSIYGWRWAAPAGIRRFPAEFNTDCDYPLTQSRRCGTNVLAAARAVIESQPGRPQKPPLEPLPGAPEGLYAYLRFPTNASEIDGAADIIAKRVAAGVPPSEIAVLVRSQQASWAAQLRPRLAAVGIALASTAWLIDALAEDEVRRGIALAQLALRPDDSLAWWSLLHLTRGVGAGFVDYVYDNAGRNERFGQALLRLQALGFPDAPTGARRADETIVATLAEIDSLDVDGAAIDDRGWGGWLLDRLDQGQLSDDANRLFEMVGAAVTPAEGLGGFLAQLEPLGKDLAASAVEGVRMMTMAQSKGLTVNTAIVLGVEEGIIPMDRPEVDPDEERRLLYVAMTRATDVCVLTYAQRRIGPSARIGAPNVGATRNRSPLLSTLPGRVGQPQHGPRFIAALV